MNWKVDRTKIEQILEDKEGYHPLKGEAASFTGLYEAFKEAGEDLPAPAKAVRAKYGNDYASGIRSHLISLGDGYATGNSDHCSKSKQWNVWTGTGYQTRENQMKLGVMFADQRITALLKADPRKRAQMLRKYAQNERNMMSNTRQKYKQLGGRKPRNTTYRVPTLSGSTAKDNNRAAFTAYARGKAGDKSVSIGQRAILFSASGTPIIGADAIYRRGTVSEFGAGIASTAPPVVSIPKSITKAEPTPVDKIGNKSTKIPVANAGDTIGNATKIALVAGVITTVMFAIQYVIQLIAFILQVTTLMANVSNIYRSVLAMFDNIMFVFGVKDASKPASQWLDGLLSSVFGKTNAEYIKYNFARCVSIFQAGANIMNLTKSATETMAEGIDDTNQNVGRIGNALRRAGLVSKAIGNFQEKVSIASAKGILAQLNQKLNKTYQVTSDIEDITAEIKSFKERDDENTKQLKEKLAKIEAEKKAQEKANTPKEIKTPDYKLEDL
jgi:hypothetical protein